MEIDDIILQEKFPIIKFFENEVIIIDEYDSQISLTSEQAKIIVNVISDELKNKTLQSCLNKLNYN